MSLVFSRGMRIALELKYKGEYTMGFKFGYSTLRWQTPDFEELLTQPQGCRLGRLGDASILRLGRSTATYSTDMR